MFIIYLVREFLWKVSCYCINFIAKYLFIFCNTLRKTQVYLFSFFPTNCFKLREPECLNNQSCAVASYLKQ